VKRIFTIILSTFLLTGVFPSFADGEMLTVIVNETPLPTREIVCTTSYEIFYALNTAEPGDHILIAPGEYEGKKGSFDAEKYLKNGATQCGFGNAMFFVPKSGTAAQPIIVDALDPDNPPVLKSTGTSTAYCLYLQGVSYVTVRNIKITNALQGLIADKSYYNHFENLEIYNIGQEGLHIRDGSSYNVIDGVNIHDTGVGRTGYGEGIYIGTSKNDTTYASDCDHNVIQNSTIGPNVDSEHIDIKEGTTGTVVINNTFNMAGIAPGGVVANSNDSSIDIKGNGVVIKGNLFNYDGNINAVAVIQTHSLVEGWGFGNIITDNIFNGTVDVPFIDVTHDTEVIAGNNYLADGVTLVLNRNVNGILTESKIPRGDANSDGVITALDIVYLKRCIVSWAGYTTSSASDINADGNIDIADLALLKRTLAQWE
jgi:hypothetical protein